MKTTRLAIAIGIGAIGAYLLADAAINSTYESAIKFLQKHKRFPLGKHLEGALVSGYLTRNVRISPVEYDLPKPLQTELVMDDRKPSHYQKDLDEIAQAHPLDWDEIKRYLPQ